MAVPVAAVLLAGCGTEQSAPVVSSTSATPTEPVRLDPATCDVVPPSGAIDRGAHDLAFRTGEIRIAVTPMPVTPPSTPAGASASVKAVADKQCFGFTRWGNSDPNVPPDSLLFVFKGPGIDGAQIEFPVGELTGGVLPPIGDVRPTVGPLTSPINVQVGASVGGAFYQGTDCALKVTAMSSRGAAGSFACSSATRANANPFDPSDDTPFDAEETSSATTAPAPAPAPGSAPAPASPSAQAGQITTVRLTGWFDVQP